MRSGLIAIGVFVLLILIIFMNGCGSYNTMVEQQQQVEAQWHQVENVYQRRADLLPNLAATVNKVAKFEQTTLTEITNARANATKVVNQIDPKDLTPEQIRQFEQAQAGVSQQIGRLLAVAEAYPELKATSNFTDLQRELAGTENRIATERGRFNEAVQDYNTSIKKFPRNIWAGMFGFKEHAYFEAKPGAENPPNMDSLLK